MCAIILATLSDQHYLLCSAVLLIFAVHRHVIMRSTTFAATKSVTERNCVSGIINSLLSFSFIHFLRLKKTEGKQVLHFGIKIVEYLIKLSF